MSTHRRLWIALGVLLSTTFAVLLLVGNDIYRSAPPMPERVVSTSGETVYTRTDIEQGRVVWQSIGGQQLGSIWGHGALVAPDWTADWLHREAMELLQMHARSTYSAAWEQLKPSEQDALKADLRIELRKKIPSIHKTVACTFLMIVRSRLPMLPRITSVSSAMIRQRGNCVKPTRCEKARSIH